MSGRQKSIRDFDLKKTPVCIIYHRSDNDGRLSAAIIREYYLANDIEPTMFPWTYGDPIPYGNTEGQNALNDSLTFVVDIALTPWSEMLRLANLARHIVWIDHHMSSLRHWQADGNELRETYAHRITPVLNVEKAACEAVWAFMHPEEDVPLAVEAVGLYDTWRWAKNTFPLELVRGLDIEDTRAESDLWLKLIRNEGRIAQNIAKRGQTIIAYQSDKNSKLLANAAFPVLWRDLHMIGINAVGNSLLFEASKYARSIHAGMCFFWKKNAWQVNLYRPGTSEMPMVDLSAIAQSMGGGGHLGASGFLVRQISLSPVDVPLFPDMGQTFIPLFQK